MRTKHKILSNLLLILICISLTLTGTLDHTGLHFSPTNVSAAGGSGSGSDNTVGASGSAQWQSCYTFGYRVYFAEASEIAKKSNTTAEEEWGEKGYYKFQAKTGSSALEELSKRQRYALYGVYGDYGSDLAKGNAHILNWNINKNAWSGKKTPEGTNPKAGAVLALDSSVAKTDKMTFAKLFGKNKLPEAAAKKGDGTTFDWGTDDKGMMKFCNTTVYNMFEKGNEEELKSFIKNYVKRIKATYGKGTPEWVTDLLNDDGSANINKLRAKKIGELPKYCLILEPVTFSKNGSKFACLTAYNGGTAEQYSNGSYNTTDRNVKPGDVKDGKYTNKGQCGFRSRAYAMRGCHEGSSTWTVSEAGTGARGFTYWWAMNNPQNNDGVHSGTNILINYSGNKITTDSTKEGLFTGTTSASTTGYLTEKANDVEIKNKSSDKIEEISASGMDDSSYLLNTHAGVGLQNKWNGVKLSKISGSSQFEKLTNCSQNANSKALYRAFRYKMKLSEGDSFKFYANKDEEYDISGNSLAKDIPSLVSQIGFSAKKIKGGLSAGEKYQITGLNSLINGKGDYTLQKLLQYHYDPNLTLSKDKEWGADDEYAYIKDSKDKDAKSVSSVIRDFTASGIMLNTINKAIKDENKLEVEDDSSIGLTVEVVAPDTEVTTSIGTVQLEPNEDTVNSGTIQYGLADNSIETLKKTYGVYSSFDGKICAKSGKNQIGSKILNSSKSSTYAIFLGFWKNN